MGRVVKEIAPRSFVVETQRAREAAEREKQRGTSTARSKWGEGEIGRFKEALKEAGARQQHQTSGGGGHKGQEPGGSIQKQIPQSLPHLAAREPPPRPARLQPPALLHSEPCQQHSRPLSGKQHHPVASSEGDKNKTSQCKRHQGENTADNLHPYVASCHTTYD